MKFKKPEKLPKYTISNHILETLEIDRSFRYSGVDGDLFTVEQLNVKTFDFTYPTIFSQYYTIKTLDKSRIIKNLVKSYPIISGMIMTNILIAGGAICNAIVGGIKTDLDIFIYGVDEYCANKTIFRVLNHLLKFKKEYKFQFIKTANALTINMDKEDENLYYRRVFTIQIIFRLYKTKSEILHSFDIGSACIGFDGIDILFTTLSKFSYEYNCNIVDNTRRSTTYEKKLVKYFQRGFKIVMPMFDINIIHLYKKYIILPNLLITEFNQVGNCITVSPWKIQSIDNKIGSDYDSTGIEFLKIDIIENINTKLTIKWIKHDPSKMLSASCNPIEDTELTWYGIYLLKVEDSNKDLLNRFKSFIRKFKPLF